MDLSTITVADFKARFYRDFQFLTVQAEAQPALPDPNFIMDQDITNAYADAQMALNQGIFTSDADIKNAYLLLAAHCLCINIGAANGGGINAPANLPVNSRSVGSVSEAYSIPQEYIDNPLYATYLQSPYGLKYLAFALPAITGNMAAVYGGTNA